ncbi:3-ketoacyl-CoA thiolase [Lactarius sanguifluus]|nr:3-ketoacyl-CoA thiolase [Lactarius sanguifluus]
MASTVSSSRAHLLQKKDDDVKGQLKDVLADELLHALFKATLEKTRLNPSEIGDICVSMHICICVLDKRQAGEISLGVAVGVESMSLNPRPTPVVSDVVGANAQARDCIQPRWTSEMVSQTYNISRQKQDEYALISHTRATKALADGVFSDEIIPIELRGAVISVDDTVRPNVSAEGLAALKPSFPEWGGASTTAGNASGVGDGAALCILTTRARAEAGGFDILAKFVGTAIFSIMIGLNYDDIDVYEINEAFASQFAHCVEQLKIPIDKINPNGGSIALTHPLGMTGVRQVVTGLEESRRRDGELLCTSMCVGSGLGAAGIFINERQG